MAKGRVALTILVAAVLLSWGSPIAWQRTHGPAIRWQPVVPGLAGSDTAAAYFKVGFPTGETSFTIKLVNPDQIQQARDILSGALNRNMHISGLVVKSPAPYNPGWGYHLDPASISFFDFATEVCDGSPHYVEEHLDEACGAFLPDCRWCPWSSRLLAEVTFTQLYLPALLR